MKGGVQPGPGSWQVPGRDHSALLLPTGPGHCPGNTWPTAAQAHPSRPTTLTSKGAVPAAVCLPCEWRMWWLELPTSAPLTPRHSHPSCFAPPVSPVALHLSLPAHKPQAGAFTHRPSASRPLTSVPPPSVQRESRPSPAPGLEERGRCRPWTVKGPTPSCLWFCHRSSSCPALIALQGTWGDTGGPGWATVLFCW